MNNKNMNKEYRSIQEIEERYFPKSLEEGLTKRPEDPRSLGILMAEESLLRIQNQLVK